VGIETLKLADVVADPAIQPRAKGLDQNHIDELAAAYEREDDVPRPVVWKIGTVYKLSQGFHRLAAALKAGRKHLECEVHVGTDLECALDAFAGNQGHGLKRTPEDKRRSIREVLKRCPDWADNRVANHLGVSDKTVADERKGMESTSEIPKSETRVGSDGRRTRTAGGAKSAARATATPVSEELVGRVAAALKKNAAATDHALAGVCDCTAAEAKAARKAAKKLTPADEPAPAAPPPDPAKPHPLDVPALTGVYTPRVVVTRPGHQVVLDAYDNPTPPGVGDCFADPALRERFMAITAAAEVLEDEYKHLIKDKSGHDPAKQFPWVEIPAMQDHVTTARNALVAAADLILAGFPYGVCPKCWGSKCKECRLSGFWPRPLCEKNAALFQKRKGA
jgi:hypothetical protein